MLKIQLFCSSLFKFYSLCESCSHVAALLFKVEADVRLGYTSSTCTDKTLCVEPVFYEGRACSSSPDRVLQGQVKGATM